MDRTKKGRFKKGQIPWNKGTKGIMKVNSGSFQKGENKKEYFPIGTIVIRTRKTRNDARRWIKIADPNKWQEYAKYIWEKNYGQIPKGKLIHHKDRNKLNDKIENLELKSRAEHLNEHRKEVNRWK
jgi:hypothetical protein